MSEKHKKKQIAKISVFITSIFVIFISISYAFITKTLEGTKNQILTAGILDLELEEDSEITISNAYPMYDEVGMIQEDMYKFRLRNKTANATDYVLKLKKVESSNLSEDIVKYGLIKDGTPKIALLSSLTDGVIDEGTITGNDTIEYELRLWIDSSVTDIPSVSTKFLSYRLTADVSQTGLEKTCPVLAEVAPNQPELTSGMIAVTYDESDKTWVKADTSNNNWYDYKNQIWANAVTVTESTRDTYMAMDAGEPISMDDINTMWVWIPRYSYTIQKPAGRGGDTIQCSTFTSPSETDSLVCIKNSEYTEEMYESARLTVQAGVVLSFAGNGKVDDFKDDAKIVFMANTMFDQEMKTMEDVIDLMLMNNILVGNGIYEDATMRGMVVQMLGATTEQEAEATLEAQGQGMTIEHWIAALALDPPEGVTIDPKYYIVGDFSVDADKSYSTLNKSMPGEIDIKFISKTAKDTGTGNCEKCADNWATPEGFTFGDTELSGFWMGKFETSILETCDVDSESTNHCNKLATYIPQVKPNVTSWRGGQVSTFFFNTRFMQDGDNGLDPYSVNTYGFDRYDEGTMDVHMSKNTEWGTALYLSQSKYGKYGNPNYEGVYKEIYANESAEFLTGMSNGKPYGSEVQTQVTYDTPNTGYGASTTGTIYGIYDMSGGSAEYVMANYDKVSGHSSSGEAAGNSGFIGTNCLNCSFEFPEDKYYDLYPSSDILYYKKGDASIETTGWYGSVKVGYGDFRSWWVRNSTHTYGETGNAFDVGNAHGNIEHDTSFRITITP